MNNIFSDKKLESLAELNTMPEKNTGKIALAMSGGVDSSISAFLLKNLGYEVIGVTGIFQKNNNLNINSTNNLVKKLNINHCFIDLSEEFESSIIKFFLDKYSQGQTPMPCVVCNKLIKWGGLFEKLKSQDTEIKYFATGHYARLLKNNSRFFIGKANDKTKDQSYMLWYLTQEQLKSSVFPLANLKKTEIKELAEKLNLSEIKEQKESQDICFIQTKTADFLRKHLGEKSGEIIHCQTNKSLGTHTGTHFFTIGQRKGIGLSNKEALYVTGIDPEKNIVYVGERNFLKSSSLITEGANWQFFSEIQEIQEFNSLIKIRYACEPFEAKIKILENNKFQASFRGEQESVTAGQACVVYDRNNNFLLGGGWISPI